MIRGGRLAAAGVLAAAVLAGTTTDVARPSTARTIGEYHVLAADFHVHMFPLGWSTLAPWDTLIEARHQGLDVIALVPHNIVWLAKVGRWLSRPLGGPMVIVGEEITAPDYHLLGVGISETVSAQLPVVRAIEEVHKQGGVAIAAHPYENSWPAFDTALGQLDGAEVVRPEAQNTDWLAAELREFYRRAASRMRPDHGRRRLGLPRPGPMGYSRTYVFARERTVQGVLDAVRDGRTVVYDRDLRLRRPGHDSARGGRGGLPHDVPDWPTPGAARLFSRIATLLVLAGVLFLNRWD